MDLFIQKLTKAFNQKIVFRDLTFDIRSGSKFAITGANGSGKSTLLKIISGGNLATSGSIRYELEGKPINGDKLFRQVHFVAPYNTVIEELTLEELFTMHRRLGLLQSYTQFNGWLKKLDYSFNARQQIKMYSSGMKQRIRLALALLDNRPLVLLDEPGSNLDQQGKAWLRNLIYELSPKQTLIIATNDMVEIGYCNENLLLTNVS